MVEVNRVDHFEYDAILGKDPNPGLRRELRRHKALFWSFSTEIFNLSFR